jgi:peptidoglycan hydrolase CwlO-like protein
LRFVTTSILSCLLAAGVLALSACATNSAVDEEQDAEVSSLSSDLEDVRGQLFTIEEQLEEISARLDELETSTVADLQSEIDAVASEFENLCGELFNYEGALEEIWYAVC